MFSGRRVAASVIITLLFFSIQQRLLSHADDNFDPVDHCCDKRLRQWTVCVTLSAAPKTVTHAWRNAAFDAVYILTLL
jgi:hypothetical protein